MYRPSKIIVKRQYLPHVPYNLVNFGLAAEIVSLVWGTPHGTLVVGDDETLRRWTEGATYIRQGGHHVGHWPTF